MYYRSVYYMHRKFTGDVGKLFKFQKLKLYAERGILHFKCPCYFLVHNKLMYHSAKPVLVSFGIGCFKLVAAVAFIFKLKYFSSHPLLNNFRFYICFEK